MPQARNEMITLVMGQSRALARISQTILGKAPILVLGAG